MRKIVLFFAVLLCIAGCTSTGSSDEPTVEETTTVTNEIYELLDDELLYENFCSVCEQIGVTLEEISDFEQADEWTGGPRYTFVYRGWPWKLYCNTDGTVETIYIGTEIDIFSKADGAYHIDSYIVDKSVSAQVELISEDVVKAALNYPSTASFPWLDWHIDRNHNVYTVISSVTAQNAYGVEEELPFTLRVELDREAMKLRVRYFALDGKVLGDEMSKVVIPERTPAVAQQSRGFSVSENDIVIISEELGDYGKIVTDTNGDEFIDYHVPAGKYIVTSNVPLCVVYVASNDYFINSAGYIECEYLLEQRFSEVGEQHEITVGEGEHVEVTYNAKVVLTPCKQ